MQLNGGAFPMKRKLCLLITLCLLAVCFSSVHAEPVRVRLWLTYFSGDVIKSIPDTTQFYDFEGVDSSASIMYFQEYSIKQTFPELIDYGTTPSNVLAYADVDGHLYDGVYTTIGEIVNPEIGYAELYLWLGSTYMHFFSGPQDAEDASEAVVYDFLDSDSYKAIMPENQDIASEEGIIATVAPLNQVFLNSRSIEVQVEDGGQIVAFTEAISTLADGRIRLTLKPVAPGTEPAVLYAESALAYLEALGIAEICLVHEGTEVLYDVTALHAEMAEAKTE